MRNAILISALLYVILVSCITQRYARGTLEINYHLHNVDSVKVSYQTVIWLERRDGTYIKPLLVSEYLSYGGFNDPTICPHWTEQADWKHSPEELFDAVTQATPGFGRNKITLDLNNEQLRPQPYRYLIEVHLLDTYNVMAVGEIDLSRDSVRTTADLHYFPQKHPQVDKLLTDVSATYKSQ